MTERQNQVFTMHYSPAKHFLLIDLIHFVPARGRQIEKAQQVVQGNWDDKKQSVSVDARCSLATCRHFSDAPRRQ
jgi:hypothetical protein